MSTKTVIVLGGGPDAEREVSLVSSKAVAAAIDRSGEFRANYQVIERCGAAELRAMSGEVFFPVLHGGWGEGGPLQELLEADGRPFVGCRAPAARTAMDKLATKLLAAQLGVPTKPGAVFHAPDASCPFELPVVLKPVHEGSSVGVHICRTASDWTDAVESARADIRKHPSRVYMVEPAVLGGRELTVGVLDGKSLSPIEIRPNVAFYDYQAKYHRDDTSYIVDPELPAGVRETVQDFASKVFQGLGARHLSRVDFLLDSDGRSWLLEVNTLPGFTDHSLLPMAANRQGLPMESLCALLVRMALRDAGKA
ncbi:MAG: D-alanine--D-alanine ligase [Phycisphaeraceae bacterium]|nr:D-alanine--D-alanine ligase [Phycisphaeraceae bacterium]